MRTHTRLTVFIALLLALMPATAQDLAGLGSLRPVGELEPGTFTISAPDSILRIYVGRAGLLGGLGHNHVVHTRGLNGSISLAPDLPDSTAEFSFAVDSLVVDDPAERERAGDGFESQPGESAIANTRENMLGPAVLAAADNPEVTVRVSTLEAGTDAWRFAVRVSLRGGNFEFELPARLTATADTLQVGADFALDHEDLGLRPFRAVAGTLRVAQELRFELRLLAERD